MELTVAALQFNADADVAANLRRILAGIEDAAAAGAQVVVAPEASMALFGADLRAVAQPLDGPFATAVRSAAASAGLLAVVGMFTPTPDGRVRNTLLITGAGVEDRYDKIHTFDAFGARESDLVRPGDRLVTVDAFGVRLGFATCYDLRFAGQFTELGRRGAEVVCVPASWGEGPGKAEQWDVLTRARAMDAQAWLVGADQAWHAPIGTDPLGIGRSCVIDPLGGVRERLGREPGLLVTTLDVDAVAAARRSVPVLAWAQE